MCFPHGQKPLLESERGERGRRRSADTRNVYVSEKKEEQRERRKPIGFDTNQRSLVRHPSSNNGEDDNDNDNAITTGMMATKNFCLENKELRKT